MRDKRTASTRSHSSDDTRASGKRKRISDALAKQSKAEQPSATTPSSAAVSPTLKSGTEKQYRGGISDDALHDIAVESGREGLHDPDYWGKNARDYNVEGMLDAGHRVNQGLISHDFRVELQQVDDDLEDLAEETDDAEDDAFDAVDEEGDLALEREGLHVEMATRGVEPPADGRDWLLGVGLLLLFFADLGLLSLASAVFGISDAQFLGIPFVNETSLAASGWVTALVVLAHFAAKQLKTGIHHLNAADPSRAAAPTTPSLQKEQ